jgi:hypothetical protein
VHGILLAADCAAEVLRTADCAAVGLVTQLILVPLLIVPMVLHMMINGRVAYLWLTRSSDRVGDQSLGRSPDIFSGSRADMSRDIFEVGWSRGGSCDRVTCSFPGSRAQRVVPIFTAWL